jgi:hypothetical protein
MQKVVGSSPISRLLKALQTTRVRQLTGRAGDPASLPPGWTATRKGAGDMAPTRPRRLCGDSRRSPSYAPRTGRWRRSEVLCASALAILAPGAHVVERRDEAFGELDVRSTQLCVERIRRHEQRPGEALGRLLVVLGAARLPGIDGVAVEAQRGDEAPLGVVGLEDLDVRGVVDALSGQGGDALAVDDRAHRS